MKVFQSKAVAWVALAAVVALIALTFRLRTVWWAFSDLLFAFLTGFCQLAALYLGQLNPVVKKKLQTCAAVCGALTVVALIAEFILFQIN